MRVGGFVGHVDGDLSAADIAAFRDQLRLLYSTLEGEAALETMEGWLSLRLVGDGLGHVKVRGSLDDYPGTGNRLKFSLDLDQTELPALATELDDACREYPVVGSP